MEERYWNGGGVSGWQMGGGGAQPSSDEEHPYRVLAYPVGEGKASRCACFAQWDTDGTHMVITFWGGREKDSYFVPVGTGERIAEISGRRRVGNG